MQGENVLLSTTSTRGDKRERVGVAPLGVGAGDCVEIGRRCGVTDDDVLGRDGIRESLSSFVDSAEGILCCFTPTQGALDCC